MEVVCRFRVELRLRGFQDLEPKLPLNPKP